MKRRLLEDGNGLTREAMKVSKTQDGGIRRRKVEFKPRPPNAKETAKQPTSERTQTSSTTPSTSQPAPAGIRFSALPEYENFDAFSFTFRSQRWKVCAEIE